MNIVVFEDAGVRKLFPITTGRPAYAITCGGFRLIDWLLEFDGNLVSLVRTYLERIQLNDFPQFQQELDSDLEWTLVVNARVAPTLGNMQRLHQLMDGRSSTESSIVVRSGWATAAALVPTSKFETEKSNWHSVIEELSTTPEIVSTENGLVLFDYPHDVIAENLACFEGNLIHRIGKGNFEQHSPNVHFGKNVQLSEHVVFDSGPGAIVIDNNVKIGPFSFFRGPVYVGPNTKISEHASIKDGSSIGHTCKIGGEIEGTILEAYSNKQHHGFLGHSYLGSWINLGAGTCNSDLKNTYGVVNMQYGYGKEYEKVPTGMQFVGCVIGDYAKTAINTCIFTGKTIGIGSMVYGFATTNVPSFVNYARTFDKIGDLPPEIIVTTQKRMFARRNVHQRPCDIQLVHDMYRVTAEERPDDLSREPLSL
ncbi:MAG: putative sugar nucleotidyl transferase [Mariniblastus sp.]